MSLRQKMKAFYPASANTFTAFTIEFGAAHAEILDELHRLAATTDSNAAHTQILD